MKVKFTNTVTGKVEFGSMIEIFDTQHVVVQADNGGRYVLNPNSDYNFRFIPNEVAWGRTAEKWASICAEEEAYEKRSRKKSY